MKKVVFFIVFLLIGVGLVAAYFELMKQPNIQTLFPILTPTPTPTSFSIENAPSDSLRGNIATMSGSVSWQSRTATEAAVIKNPINIQQGESLVTGKNGEIGLEFAGKLDINISADSQLDIIQTLPANLVFSQSAGEIEYLKISDIPVSVRSQNLLIDVGVGDVIVTVDPNYPIIYVRSTKGSATLAYNNLQNITKIFTVSEGEQGLYYYNARRLLIRNIPR